VHIIGVSSLILYFKFHGFDPVELLHTDMVIRNRSKRHLNSKLDHSVNNITKDKTPCIKTNACIVNKLHNRKFN